MPAPSTINAVGYYTAKRANNVVGEATLRMADATKGSLALGGKIWRLTGDESKKAFRAVPRAQCS